MNDPTTPDTPEQSPRHPDRTPSAVESSNQAIPAGKPAVEATSPTASSAPSSTEPRGIPSGDPLTASEVDSTSNAAASAVFNGVPHAAPTATANVRDILNAPVTEHMRNATPLLRDNQTISEALAHVRGCPEVGRVVYFYVVDANQHLQGVVATRKLLLSPLETKISEIMSSRMITIPHTATVLEACEFFTLHKLLAFPIVDAAGKIVGAVDVDLYTDEIQEIDRRQDSEDLFQLIGLHLTEAEQSNTRVSFFARFPWLLCNVGGGMLSAVIADGFQDVSTLAVVAPFIALVTALAESVSIQSVSIALQALHAQPPRWTNFLRKVQQEVLVGLLLGAASGLTVALVAFLWKGSLMVAASLFLGITGGVVMSAAVGLAMPFVLKMFQKDPQLASGPIALALSDVVTLLCYFNLGRLLLGSLISQSGGAG